MSRLTPQPPNELILEISVTAEGKLEVYPRGLKGNPESFLIEPVLSSTDEQPAVTTSPESLGATYYQALFAGQPALREWLEARITLGHGRLIFSLTPETLLEQWETLATSNKKLLVVQGIAIERRLVGVPLVQGPVRPAAVPRVLWVAPQQLSDEDSGARRMHRLLDDAIVDCKPPLLQNMLDLLAAARASGRPFQALHLAGQGFFAFQKEPGQSELYFRNPQGGIRVDTEHLREQLRCLQLVVLEDYPAVGSHDPPDAWPEVVPYLLRCGVPSVIVVPFPKDADQTARFVDRLYDELGSGKTIGQAVSAGRRALLIEPARRPAATDTPVERRDGASVQLYQHGADVALVHSPVAGPVAHQPSAPARSSISTEPVFVSSTDVASTPSPPPSVWKVFRPYIALGLAIALGAGAWTLRNHIGEARQRKAQAQELAAEHDRIEEEVRSCLHPSPFHCGIARDLLEKCVAKLHPGLWAECSSWLGDIKAGGLDGNADPSGAVRDFTKACAGGYREACLKSGLMKQEGTGLTQAEYLEARQDFERGCELGNLESCHNAALLYVTHDPEHGLLPDLGKAKPLYLRACAEGRGNPSACTGLGSLYEDQNERKEAHRWFSFACQHGDLLGCTRQGNVTLNLAERTTVYRKACDTLDSRRGACSGCLALAKHYGSSGREKDAATLLQELCWGGSANPDTESRSCRAAPEVHGAACRFLGWIEEKGMLERSVNVPAAQRAYREGCASHDAESCQRLACAAPPRSR